MKQPSSAFAPPVPRPEDDFRSAVLSGLQRPPRRVPPKYFYDARGAELFEEICRQPEYYVARAEQSIIAAQAGELARLLGPDVLLVELGSGSGTKTRLLLDALVRPAGYVPVDICAAQLEETARRMTARYPGLPVRPLGVDFCFPFVLDRPPPARRTVAWFPGSTIGNLEPVEAIRLLRRLRALVGTGGALLIGVDLKKDTAVLEAAYNDAAGVTAAFNLNLLTRINRELGGDFHPPAFAHQAFYNAGLGRIEMHLVSRRDQLVTVARQTISLRRGETIHTENSYKYAIEEFVQVAQLAGFASRRVWLDTDNLFSVHLFAAASARGA